MPNWLTAAVRNADVLRRQMEPAIKASEAMSRQFESAIQASEAMRRQFEPIFRNNEALRHQMEPIVKAAEQLARTPQWPKLSAGLGLPVSLRVTLAVTAELRGLTQAPGSGEHDLTITGVPATATGKAIPGTVTVTGETAMPPMGRSSKGAVEEPASGRAERSFGQILALVLVAIITSGLLGVQGPDRAAMDHYLTVLSFALPIATLIWTKQNK